MPAFQSRSKVSLVAEFIIISAGVVFGLFADEWRQSRSDREHEREALLEIVGDLRADSIELERLAARMQTWDMIGRWANQHVGKEVPRDSASAIVSEGIYYYQYRPQRSAFTGLRDSGDIPIVRDAQTRLQVVTYFSSTQVQIERLCERILDALWTDMSPALRRYLTASQPDNASLFVEGITWSLDREWQVVSQEPELANAWEALGIMGGTLARFVAAAQDENHQLIENLTAYLGA